MKLSKKVIFAGAMALASFQSFGHSSELDIDDFSQDKIVKSAKIENTQPTYKDENDLDYLEHFYTGKKVPIEKIIQEGGIFLDPINKDEIIYITLEHGKLDYFEKNNFKNKDDFDRLSAITKAMDLIFKSDANFTKNPALKSSAFYNTDYHEDKPLSPDYINLGDKNIQDFKKVFEKNNATQESIDAIDSFIFYHEYAHSHQHQEKIKINKENIGDQETIKDKIKTLKKENYADAFGLLMISKKILQNNDNDTSREKIKNFFEGLSALRNDKMMKSIENNYFNNHYSNMTTKGIFDLINNNLDMVRNINNQSLQNISIFYTDEVFNHKLFEPNIQDKISFHKLYLYDKDEVSKIISDDVSSKLKEKIKFKNEDGKVSLIYFEDNNSSKRIKRNI